MALHTQAVWSKEPETMCWLSGENETELTGVPSDLSRPEVMVELKPQLLIGSSQSVEPNLEKAVTFKVSL
jgi:hypothetical protein